MELHTARLRLRQWCDEDYAPFAALNGDARVMEYFPQPLSRAESDALAARIRSQIEANGYGFWAVEVLADHAFAGAVGIAPVSFTAAFTPAVEMAWRLAPRFWGKGYAREAAQAARDHGFRHLGLRELVAFTVPANVRSRRVMESIGLVRNPSEDFDHPLIPEGDPLRTHVLYRAQNPRR